MKNIIHNPEQEHNLKQVKNHKSQPQITNSSHQIMIVLKKRNSTRGGWRVDGDRDQSQWWQREIKHLVQSLSALVTLRTRSSIRGKAYQRWWREVKHHKRVSQRYLAGLTLVIHKCDFSHFASTYSWSILHTPYPCQHHQGKHALIIDDIMTIDWIANDLSTNNLILLLGFAIWVSFLKLKEDVNKDEVLGTVKGIPKNFK